MDLVIRAENPSDYFAVEELTRDAFWNLYKPGCDEHYTAHKLRSSSDFITSLDFVAETGGRIVGSIMYTRSFVENETGERMETATFGPLCVHPDFQRTGIGTKLIEHTREIVIEMGYPAIIIWGDPHNYCKHGFKTGRDFNIASADGRFPAGLLVLELTKDAFKDHKWTFHESRAYEVDEEELELFEKRFPERKKEYHYSQELFSIMVRSYVED